MTTGKRAHTSWLGIAMLLTLFLALAAGPATAAGIGDIDQECGNAGFDFGIAKWEWNGSQFVLESERDGYDTNVTGTNLLATWTSEPPADGVIVKAGQTSTILPGGSGGIIEAGLHATSHITLCGNFPTPSAGVVTTCDPIGEQMGTIDVTVLNAGDQLVEVLIDGAPAFEGSNNAAAGEHTVVVLVGAVQIHQETVLVTPCSEPLASATPTCDPFGPELGNIEISVTGLAEGDVAVATIDGNPATIGSNLVGSGIHNVLVTVNGAQIHSQQLTVADCGTPVAAAASTCDPFGTEFGAIEIAVTGLAANETPVVTIDGAPASVGSNSASAGQHPVLVTLAGQTLLDETVSVAACSTPTAAAVAACDPDGAALGSIQVSLNGLAVSDQATVDINGSPGIVGTNPAAQGVHQVAVSVNGAQVLSQTVPIPACAAVLGEVFEKPSQVLGETLVAGGSLPATGPALPIGQTALYGLAFIASGATALASASPRFGAYRPKHRASRRAIA